jgi:molybdopterin-synthase adenylyltransferase
MKKITTLNDGQLERFSRQILIDKFGYKGQLSLMNSSVLIIGCGGLGSAAINYLVMSGLGHIGIIDYDKVDISNLSRQSLFDERDIGLSKVEVAKRKILTINSDISLNCYNLKVTKNNISELLDPYKFILDCSDNFNTRYLINDACYRQNKILISAALHNFEIQLFNFKAWANTSNPCYRCIFPKFKGMRSIGNCNDLGIISPVAGIGGLFQAMAVINNIINTNNSRFREFIIFDSFNMNQTKIKVKKNNKCILCNESSK